jgi:hypothetical protein
MLNAWVGNFRGLHFSVGFSPQFSAQCFQLLRFLGLGSKPIVLSLPFELQVGHLLRHDINLMIEFLESKMESL